MGEERRGRGPVRQSGAAQVFENWVKLSLDSWKKKNTVDILARKFGNCAQVVGVSGGRSRRVWRKEMERKQFL